VSESVMRGNMRITTNGGALPIWIQGS